jgi:hypothetical protein
MFLKIHCPDDNPFHTAIATVDDDGVETPLMCVTNIEMKMNCERLEVILTCFNPGLDLLVPMGAVKVMEAESGDE